MEEDQMSIKDKEIYETLEYLKKIETLKNLEILEKNIVKKKLKTFLTFTNKIIKAEEKKINPLNCLNILENLEKKLKFSNLFNDLRFDIILNYNLACCYQISWSQTECIYYLKKTILKLENFLKSMYKNSREFSLTISYKYLMIKNFYLLVILQITAVYSTEKKHLEAQECCLKALDIAKEIFVYYNKLFVFLEKDLKEEKSERFFLFFDNFKQFLDIILGSKNQISSNKINIFKFIQWKHTPENNKKLFGSYCKDIFQSKKFNAHWITNYNIGHIMYLLPINLDLFENNLPQNLFKKDDFVLRLIIYCSTACYSLSTEKRYLALEELGYDPEKNKAKKKSQKFVRDDLNDYKKNSNLKKNQKFIESEFFHLKSIEILQNFVEDFTLTNYIQDTYKKSYSNMMNFITEEEEVSQSYSNLLKSNSKIKKNDSYYDDKKNIIINNITITKTNCNIMNNPSFESNTNNNNDCNKNKKFGAGNIDTNFLKNIYKKKFKNDEDILFSKFSIQEESVDFSGENSILNTEKMSFKNKKEMIKNLFHSSKDNTLSNEFQQNPKFLNLKENAKNLFSSSKDNNLSIENLKIPKFQNLKQNEKNLSSSSKEKKNKLKENENLDNLDNFSKKNKHKIDICFNYNFKKEKKNLEKKFKKIKSCKNNIQVQNDKKSGNFLFINDEIKNRFLKTMKINNVKLLKEKKAAKIRKKKIVSKNENKPNNVSIKKIKRIKLNKHISLDIKMSKNNFNNNFLKSELNRNIKNSPQKSKRIKNKKEIKSFKKKKKNLNRTKEKIFPKNHNLMNILNKYQTIDFTYKNKIDKFFINKPSKITKTKNENIIHKNLNSQRCLQVKKKLIRPLTSRKKKNKSSISNQEKINKHKISFVENDKKNFKRIFSPKVKNFSSFIGKSFNSLKWNSNIVSYLNKNKYK